MVILKIPYQYYGGIRIEVIIFELTFVKRQITGHHKLHTLMLRRDRLAGGSL